MGWLEYLLKPTYGEPVTGLDPNMWRVVNDTVEYRRVRRAEKPSEP